MKGYIYAILLLLLVVEIYSENKNQEADEFKEFEHKGYDLKWFEHFAPEHKAKEHEEAEHVGFDHKAHEHGEKEHKGHEKFDFGIKKQEHGEKEHAREHFDFGIKKEEHGEKEHKSHKHFDFGIKKQEHGEHEHKEHEYFGFGIKKEQKGEEKLISMTKWELMDIVKCISKSRSRILHSKFEHCESLLPSPVKIAYETCKVDEIPKGMDKCNYYSVLYDSPEVADKIVDCIFKETKKLEKEEDKKKVEEFEECTKKIYFEACHPRFLGFI